MCFLCVLVFLDTCEAGRASRGTFQDCFIRQSSPSLGKFKALLPLESWLPWGMVGCRYKSWVLLLSQLPCLKSSTFRFFCKALRKNTVISEREDAVVKYLMPL